MPPKFTVINNACPAPREDRAKEKGGFTCASCPECEKDGFTHSQGLEVHTDLMDDGQTVRRGVKLRSSYMCPYCLSKGKVTWLAGRP